MKQAPTKQKKENNGWFKRWFGQVNKAAFWVTLSISIVLIVVSFILPPQGAIDPSVLAATGELFAFSSLGVVIEGIEKGRGVSISKGQTTVTLNDKDNKEIE